MLSGNPSSLSDWQTMIDPLLKPTLQSCPTGYVPCIYRPGCCRVDEVKKNSVSKCPIGYVLCGAECCPSVEPVSNTGSVCPPSTVSCHNFQCCTNNQSCTRTGCRDTKKIVNGNCPIGYSVCINNGETECCFSDENVNSNVHPTSTESSAIQISSLVTPIKSFDDTSSCPGGCAPDQDCIDGICQNTEFIMKSITSSIDASCPGGCAPGLDCIDGICQGEPMKLKVTCPPIRSHQCADGQCTAHTNECPAILNHKYLTTCPVGKPMCTYAPGKFECCLAGEACIPNVGCRC
jgi:hypothetical protein